MYLLQPNDLIYIAYFVSTGTYVLDPEQFWKIILTSSAPIVPILGSKDKILNNILKRLEKRNRKK